MVGGGPGQIWPAYGQDSGRVAPMGRTQADDGSRHPSLPQGVPHRTSKTNPTTMATTMPLDQSAHRMRSRRIVRWLRGISTITGSGSRNGTRLTLMMTVGFSP